MMDFNFIAPIVLFTFFLVPARGMGFFGGLFSSLLTHSKARRAARRQRHLEMAQSQAALRQAQIAQARLERELPVQRAAAHAAAAARTGFTGSDSGPGEHVKASFEASAAEARELAQLGVNVGVMSQSALIARHALEKRQLVLEPFVTLSEEGIKGFRLGKELGLF